MSLPIRSVTSMRKNDIRSRIYLNQRSCVTPWPSKSVSHSYISNAVTITSVSLVGKYIVVVGNMWSDGWCLLSAGWARPPLTIVGRTLQLPLRLTAGAHSHSILDFEEHSVGYLW